MNNPWRAAGWVLLGASLILALSLGIRHGFGLFLSPMSGEYGWGREVFAFAIALQNLIWGLAQPITGAVADRFGARRVIIGGGLLYAAGLALMAGADSAGSLSLSAGLLIGIGLSGTSFSVLLGVVGRALPAEQRSIGMGMGCAPPSLMDLIPASLTPAAPAISSARARASATARLRASACTGAGSCRPNSTPFSVLAPSFTAASSRAPKLSSARTRTVTVFEAI